MSERLGPETASIPVAVLQTMREHVRCVGLANGRLVYEFWVDGKRSVRIDADAYDALLARVRKSPHPDDLFAVEPEIVERANYEDAQP